MLYCTRAHCDSSKDALLYVELKQWSSACLMKQKRGYRACPRHKASRARNPRPSTQNLLVVEHGPPFARQQKLKPDTMAPPFTPGGAQDPKLSRCEVRQHQYAAIWRTSLQSTCVADPACEPPWPSFLSSIIVCVVHGVMQRGCFRTLLVFLHVAPYPTFPSPAPTHPPPPVFCTSLFCGWCVSYYLRRRALRGDMTRYLCCNGDWPCSGRCGEQKCPAFCLCMEVVLCFPQSVASTRWMLQDEMRLRNTKCDNCIIGTLFVSRYLACICWCAAVVSGNDTLGDAARLIDFIADFIWVS
jgi:hypothetical protein